MITEIKGSDLPLEAKIMKELAMDIIKIFAPKKQKLKQRHKSVRVCQNCGHKW